MYLLLITIYRFCSSVHRKYLSINTLSQPLAQSTKYLLSPQSAGPLWKGKYTSIINSADLQTFRLLWHLRPCCRRLMAVSTQIFRYILLRNICILYRNVFVAGAEAEAFLRLLSLLS